MSKTTTLPKRGRGRPAKHGFIYVSSLPGRIRAQAKRIARSNKSSEGQVWTAVVAAGIAAIQKGQA